MQFWLRMPSLIAAVFTVVDGKLAVFAIVACTFFLFRDKTAAVGVSVTIEESTLFLLQGGSFPIQLFTGRCRFVFFFSGLFISAIVQLLEFAR